MPMPNEYDNPIGYGNEDLVAAEEALAERKAALQARALLAARQAGIYAMPQPQQTPDIDSALVPGFKYTGQLIKPSLLASLTPLVAGARDAYEKGQLASDTSGFRRADAEAAAAHIAAMPKDTPAIPGILPATPNDDEGNLMPIPRQPVAAREVTPAERIAWAQKGQNIPSLRSTLQSVIADQIVKQPERDDARAERVATAAANRAEKAERAEADRNLRRDINDSNVSSREFIAQLVKGGGRGGGGGGGSSTTAVNLTDDNGNPVEGWARKGVKASDVVKDVAADGTVTLTDKLTGQRLRVGGGGRTAASFDKDNLDRKELINSANEGLNLVRSIKGVLPKASSSVYEAGKGWIANKFNITTEVAAANAQLETLTGALTSMIPRLPGPVSNADLLFLQQQAADAANPNKTVGQRMAALEHAEARLERILKNTAPPTNTAPTSSGNLRQDVINANKHVNSSGPVKFGDLK